MLDPTSPVSANYLPDVGYPDGSWYFDVITNPRAPHQVVRGTVSVASRKRERYILEFRIDPNNIKKFYLCEFCKKSGSIGNSPLSPRITNLFQFGFSTETMLLSIFLATILRNVTVVNTATDLFVVKNSSRMYAFAVDSIGMARGSTAQRDLLLTLRQYLYRNSRKIRPNFRPLKLSLTNSKRY